MKRPKHRTSPEKSSPPPPAARPLDDAQLARVIGASCDQGKHFPTAS